MKAIFTFLALFSFISTVFAQDDPKAIINLETLIWCENQDILFDNGSLNANKYLWRFGDGTTSEEKTPTRSYTIKNRTESFNITLVVTDTLTDKSDSMKRELKIQKGATAKFRYRPIATICIFHNESEGFDGLTWDFGDGKTSFSISDSLTHAYPIGVDSVYKVTLVANTTFGCNDTAEHMVSIVDSAQGNGGNSIAEMNRYGLKMFPNPSNDQILQFEVTAQEQLSISVSDINGRTIYSLNNSYQPGIHQIQIGTYLNDQAPGLYFVTLNNERETYVLKAYKPK